MPLGPTLLFSSMIFSLRYRFAADAESRRQAFSWLSLMPLFRLIHFSFSSR
jgi:hypothetical protein